MKPLSILACSVCAVLATSAPLPAASQPYPAKPVRMIIPFPPGGATDILGRVLAQKLSEQLGQSVVIDNRPGAGGGIGTELTAKAPPDGYTIQMATVSTHSIGPALNPKTPYDVKRDFVPIAHVADATNILITSPTLPVSTLKELIAHARANPGRLNFSSSGNGTIVHMTGEMFKMATGTFIVHIPYRGTALAIPDLIAGQVAFMFENIASGLPHIKSGKVRALGISQLKRSPLVPDIPTMDEAGLKGFESNTYFGVFAPAGTPPAVAQRLNAEINKAVESTDVRGRFAALGAEPVGGTSEQFARVIERETVKYAAVIKRAGIKPE
ncbi:MAG: tripartite tricarboxylate transporter substrate binding protein [Burkholderiales bacterium]|nr:tripartite tricarboxylate transporter substrate binding protein [Burkholderiales bacterium]